MCNSVHGKQDYDFLSGHEATSKRNCECGQAIHYLQVLRGLRIFTQEIKFQV